MKAFRLLGALALSSLLFAACESENELASPIAATEETDAQDAVQADVLMEEAAEYGDEALLIAERGGRFSAYERRIPECASVTHDRALRQVLIDFGDGCEGPQGHVRAGQLRITYGQADPQEGLARTVEFIGYSIDGRGISGRLSCTVTRQLDARTKTRNVTTDGLSVQFEDGTSFTVTSATRTETWVFDGSSSTLSIEGQSAGTNRRGQAVRMEISEPVVYSRACAIDGIRCPVQGLKAIEVGDRPALSIDFGDGTCDRVATVSANGQTKTIELRR